MLDALPDFREPPLQEVALSVQFMPLDALSVPHVGLLWDRFRERFPKTEEHPPIEPAVERFGPAQIREPIQLRVRRRYPTPRVWFVNESETNLIQIQEDRFVANWRKRNTEVAYPRYPLLCKNFFKDFKVFEEFIESQVLGELDLVQCEVTYVNLIELPTSLNFNDALTFFQESYSESFLPDLEGGALRLRYVITSSDNPDKPRGRLHIHAELERRSRVRLVLTARGPLLGGEGTEGVRGFFDLGREWIVRGFTAMTSDQLHKLWGRTQ